MSSSIPFVRTNRIFGVAGLIAFALLNAPQSHAQSQPGDTAVAKPEFEVATVKPNRSADRMVMIQNGAGGRFVAKNVSLKMLMRMAYKVQDFQISGGPAWISSERYDIEAKPESPSIDDMRKLTDEQREAFMEQQRLRLQALLADRFQLKLHPETKELPVYALVIAKNGPKLQESKIEPAGSEPPPNPAGSKGSVPRFKGQGMRMGRGELSGQSAPISILADTLSNQIGRTVIDKTGLKGRYDFTLKWTPDETQGQMFKGPGDGGEGRPPSDAAPTPDASGPSVFTAIQEQLGLKLESQKGPVQVLVIDQVEKPTEN